MSSAELWGEGSKGNDKVDGYARQPGIDFPGQAPRNTPGTGSAQYFQSRRTWFARYGLLDLQTMISLCDRSGSKSGAQDPAFRHPRSGCDGPRWIPRTWTNRIGRTS
jgi:hypothetical protein